MLVHHVGNRVMVGGDPDLLRAAQRALFRNSHHHRLAGNRQQRFARQPGGRVARRYYDVESWSSKHFDFFGGKLARFVDQHHRNAVFDSECQPVGLADQFLRGF